MSDGEKCKGCRNGEDFPVPFSMAFQPNVDVIDRRIYSYEALVRGPDDQSAASVLARVTPENRYTFDKRAGSRPSSRRRR